eukprot:1392624-Pyramimonas_sp.AAC.2
MGHAFLVLRQNSAKWCRSCTLPSGVAARGRKMRTRAYQAQQGVPGFSRAEHILPGLSSA